MWQASAQPAYFSLLNSPIHCTNMQLAERITHLLDYINHMHHSHAWRTPAERTAAMGKYGGCIYH